METTTTVKIQSSADAGTSACRFCGGQRQRTVVDLGMSPLCESYIAADQLDEPETFYPLHATVCEACHLVQLPQYVSASAIFSDYAYFSSYSDSWVRHAGRYAEQVVERFRLGCDAFVVEIASNDGYLLQHFVGRDIPCLGVEPAANVAAVAVQRGVPTAVRFFGRRTAHELRHQHGAADLLVGNNVLAHVPELNDFVSGLKVMLKGSGVLTLEFPHLRRLIEGGQFDTIYHEHFSYFSFLVAERVLARHGLAVFDVEELPTHGGSLRIFARHVENASIPVDERVAALRAEEVRLGFASLERYVRFGREVEQTRYALLDFLISQKKAGKQVAGYGAPGKGNTLLNYCGIRSDLLAYTVDRNTNKQGRYTPGSRIPILDPDAIRERRPDFVLILPWNLQDEIMSQLSYVRTWGAKFVVPIPSVQVL